MLSYRSRQSRYSNVNNITFYASLLNCQYRERRYRHHRKVESVDQISYFDMVIVFTFILTKRILSLIISDVDSRHTPFLDTENANDEKNFHNRIHIGFKIGSRE